MKPLSQAEFDNLLARRVNLIAKTMQEIANTCDNNPALITAEKFGKALEHMGTVEQNMAAVVTAAIDRPAPLAVGEFTLGEPKPTRKPRAKTAAVAAAPALTAVVTAAPAVSTDDSLTDQALADLLDEAA